MNFVHLHIHSSFSIADGACKPDDLAKKCNDLGMTHAAITDHGTVSGWYKFRDACKKNGIKPIYGIEAYFKHNEIKSHITILAKTTQGLSEIYKLQYQAAINGAITLKDLENSNSQELIVLTGCCAGPLYKIIFADHKKAYGARTTEEAKSYIDSNWLSKGVTFISELKEAAKNLYIEIQSGSVAIQDTAIDMLREIAKQTGLKCVPTCDVHYINKKDYKLQELILSVNRNSHQTAYHNVYLKTGKELTWASEEEKSNTVYIANQCNTELLDFSPIIYKMPNIDIREICHNKLTELGLNNNQEYADRLSYELDVIYKFNLENYFAIVMDMCRYADSKGIIRGYGRGCLTGETLVLTENNGYIRLDSLKIGDKVYTHTGESKKIKNTFRYECKDEGLVTLRTEYSSSPLTFTKDHMVYGIKNFELQSFLHRKNNKKIKRWATIEHKPIWIRVDNLKIGDMLFTPFIKRTTISPDRIDLATLNLHDELTDDKVIINIPLKNEYSIRYLSKVCNISRGCLQGIKKQKKSNHISDTHKMSKNTHAKLKIEMSKSKKTIADWISNPNIRVVKINRFIDFNEDFAYLLGRWIGDGWLTERGKFGIAFHSNDILGIEKITSYLNGLGFDCKLIKSKTKNLVQLMVYNKIIVGLMKKLFPNYVMKSYSKYLGDFRKLPDDILRCLLIGLLDSDGHIGKDREVITTTSYKMAIEIKEALLYLKIPSSMMIRDEHDRGEYRCNKSFYLKFKGVKLPIRKNGHRIQDDGYYSKIIGVSKNTEQYVYDIEVDKDSSYLTSNYAVHNSAAGAIVCYLLNITLFDPLPFGLIFERFINEGRVSKGRIEMPDIDLDFEAERRDEIVQYLKQKYGEDQMMPIVTYDEFKVKNSIQDVCRLYDNDNTLLIGKRIIELHKKEPVTVEELLDNSEVIENISSLWKDILLKAKTLQGFYRHRSRHASGYVIMLNLKERLPVRTEKKEVIVEYGLKDAEHAGGLKFDILGVSTLSSIKYMQEAVKKIKDLKSKEMPLINV